MENLIPTTAHDQHARRKREHVRVCLEEDVRHPRLTTGFEALRLPYASLPELDLAAVDLRCEMLGKTLTMPFMIPGMTGGAALSRTINRNLARAAQRVGVALGLGSMRVALENPEAAESFRVRDLCPDVPLWANLGAVQLNYGCGVEECLRLVEDFEADGLCLHVNALQEVAQRGGDTDWSGLFEKIGAVAGALPVPVIVKEVGFGMNRAVAERLSDLPIWGLDVGGAGGTSWLEVEKRVWERDDLDAFDELGTPTATSIRAARGACPGKVVVGSGGVRTGVDAAKALALGADFAGAAIPLLAPAVESAEAAERWLARFREELRLAAFCAGVADVGALAAVPLEEVTGSTRPLKAPY
jgi:isopentenyl-diphosphate delta-isomerase